MKSMNWRLWAKTVAVIDMAIFSLKLAAVVVFIVVYPASSSVQEYVRQEIFDINTASGDEKVSGNTNLILEQNLSDETVGIGSSPQGENNISFNTSVLNLIVSILIALFAACAATRLWAAIQLHCATDTDTISKSPSKSMRRTKVWRNVSIVFLIIDFIVGVSMSFYIYTAFTVMLRTIFLAISIGFMKDLQRFSSLGAERQITMFTAE